MFAPRMHERYLYYPLVFLIPIALESEFLTSIFGVVTGTFLFNLCTSSISPTRHRISPIIQMRR